MFKINEQHLLTFYRYLASKSVEGVSIKGLVMMVDLD